VFFAFTANVGSWPQQRVGLIRNSEGGRSFIDSGHLVGSWSLVHIHTY
jgi:hypothetical protein